MALEQKQQRNTAYKVWIGDLFKSNISLDENKFNFIEMDGRRIVRVNILANIVEKFQHPEKPFASITLDDSSGQIRAKTFDKPEDFEAFDVGSTVLVIGVLRFFNNELYMLPEIIKAADAKWLVVRKLELGKPIENPSEYSMDFQEGSKQESEKVNESEFSVTEISRPQIETIKISSEKIAGPVKKEAGIKEILYNKIKEKADGLDIDELIMSVNFPVAEINTTITEMIEEGKIYEPQPGRLRSI